MAKNNKQAKKMASAGKSAAQIKAKTGVGSQTAQRYVARQAPAPSPAPASRPAPKPATPSRSTPEIKGVNQGLKIAGGNGISKSDLKDIAKATGKEPEKIVGRLDKLNTKLEDKDKAGINLKSGTANMLVKNAQKSPPKYRGFGADSKDIRFGDGAIGSTLQSMIPTPANAGTWIKGQLTGAKEADPGFNPGGKPDKNSMIGGTVIRPNGKIAVKGAGEQYELPNKFKPEEVTPEATPEATPEVTPETTPEEVIDETPITPEIPEVEEEEVDNSASSGAGGLDLASWATGFKKARSARQKSGRSAQGLASQKKNPFKSWA
jgi:hypothetical protein